MKYKKLLMPMVFLLTSCVGSNQDNNPPANNYAVNKATARDNNVYFGDNIVPYNDQLFTEISHSITDGQPYAKPEKLDSNGVHIRAGRKGSINPAKWLLMSGYAISPYIGSETDLFSYHVANNSMSTNFAILGNLWFQYKPNAQPYGCFGVGLVQIHIPNKNFFGFISNIEPGFYTMQTYSFPEQDISCINQLTKQEQKFTVKVKDTYNFDITIKNSAASPNMLDETKFGEILTKAFNSIDSSDTKNKLFSNGIYGVGGAKKFVIYNPREFSFNKFGQSAVQTSIYQTSETTLWTDVSGLPNDSPINQTFPSTSHSVSITNSVTTTTTNTVGGKISTEVSYSGPLKLVSGKTAIEANYSYSDSNSTTTSKTEQYTTPSAPIFIPPYCKAIVSQSLSQSTFAGTYEFSIGMTGSAKVDGVSFSELLPSTTFVVPMVYRDNNAGVVDFYTVLSQAKYTDPRIQLDPATKIVNFIGSGTFEGRAGTSYVMNVSFVKLRPDANCGSDENIVLRQ